MSENGENGENSCCISARRENARLAAENTELRGLKQLLRGSAGAFSGLRALLRGPARLTLQRYSRGVLARARRRRRARAVLALQARSRGTLVRRPRQCFEAGVVRLQGACRRRRVQATPVGRSVLYARRAAAEARRKIAETFLTEVELTRTAREAEMRELELLEKLELSCRRSELRDVCAKKDKERAADLEILELELAHMEELNLESIAEHRRYAVEVEAELAAHRAAATDAATELAKAHEDVARARATTTAARARVAELEQELARRDAAADPESERPAFERIEREEGYYEKRAQRSASAPLSPPRDERARIVYVAEQGVVKVFHKTDAGLVYPPIRTLA